MKKCSKCLSEQPLDHFFFRDKTAEELHSQCKTCYSKYRKKYYKSYYLEHGAVVREYALQRKHRIKNELRQKLITYLKGKMCASCGIRDPRVLDIDHIDATQKSFDIARGLTNALRWEKILSEIKKCQILSANCHRIRTAKQYNWSAKI